MLASLLALSLMGAPASVWPHPETCHVLVDIAGTFSARGEFEVNLINAPPVGGPVEPPPLALAEETLAAWNHDLPEVVSETLRDLHLAASFAKADGPRFRAKAAPLESGTADRYFELRVEVSPENGLGGHAAGNALHFSLRSLHRASDLVGEARTEAQASAIEDAPAGLRGAVVAGITQAFVDFQSHLDDERSKPRAHATLTFALGGLDSTQKEYLGKVLAPCAASLAEPLSTALSSTPTEQKVDLEYRLRRHEATETEDAFLTHLAGTLSFEIGHHGKDRCSLWQTPLDKLDVHVTKDLATKRIGVRFTPQDSP